MGYFEPAVPDGARVRFDKVEISVLRGYATQLLELLGPGTTPTDDAEALLASVFEERSGAAPDDPVLARLFPDAYGEFGAEPDDVATEASAEFRRYTEVDLRARKRADVLAVMRSLDRLRPTETDGDELRLDGPECRQWLGALNDLRLALGTRLDISDEQDGDAFLRLPDSDSRKPSAMVYLWLSGLQETLVDALMSAPDDED